MSKVLFIHVPKTSGTSLTALLKTHVPGFFVQANDPRQLDATDPLVGRVRDLADIRHVLRTHGGLALHVDSSFGDRRETTDFRSLACHVFDPSSVDDVRQCTILTMLRDPFRSFLSSYAFVRQAKARDPGFLPDLHLGSVEDYLEAVHENAVLHFLLEPQLARRRVMNRDDLTRVKVRIDEHPIHVGIYERYADSIAYFARVLGRDFDRSDVPRHNVGRADVPVDTRLEAAFRERNALDIELYAFAARLLDERSAATDDERSSVR